MRTLGSPPARWQPRPAALLGAALLAGLLAGCASMGKDQFATAPEHRRDRDRLSDPDRWLNSLAWPTTAPDSAASSQPASADPAAARAAAALADLQRAKSLIAQLDHPAARRVLLDLEGRLILAHDLGHSADAAFWLAFCDEKLDLLDAAAAEYARLIERYPDSPQARSANDRLNRLRPTRARVAPQ